MKEDCCWEFINIWIKIRGHELDTIIIELPVDPELSDSYRNI